jgi:hypothetical protein
MRMIWPARKSSCARTERASLRSSHVSVSRQTICAFQPNKTRIKGLVLGAWHNILCGQDSQKFTFMKKYVILFMVGFSLALTGCCSTRHSEKNSKRAPSLDVSTIPWSVVGVWRCTHPAWNNTITISPDGTFYSGSKDPGHWTLAGLQDRVILVLAWNRWPVETATMISPDDFRGKVRDGELVMHRV